MDPNKIRRSNQETLHKPYRSTASFYTDYKEEIPDATYYNVHHSEFKKPWLPFDGGYDEMEYRWDFPLEYLNPISIDFEFPDSGKYQFPSAPTVNPDWQTSRWNPSFPEPGLPKPYEYSNQDPREDTKKRRKKVHPVGCEGGGDVEYCPGDTITVQFLEYSTDPITSVIAEHGTVLDMGQFIQRRGSNLGYRDVTIQIDEFITDGSWRLAFTAKTDSGRECTAMGTEGDHCFGGGCSDVSIGYTTTNMLTGWSQTLIVVDGVPGIEYEWSVSGGGGVSEQRGNTTVYTAPTENPNCSQNAIIYLKEYKSGTVCASLSIGISSNVPGDAYWVYQAGMCKYTYTSPPAGWCEAYYNIYNCQGVLTGLYGANFYQNDSTCGIPPCTVSMLTPYSCQDNYCEANDPAKKPGQIEDRRTEEMKLAGCCPSGLI